MPIETPVVRCTKPHRDCATRHPPCPVLPRRWHHDLSSLRLGSGPGAGAYDKSYERDAGCRLPQSLSRCTSRAKTYLIGIELIDYIEVGLKQLVLHSSQLRNGEVGTNDWSRDRRRRHRSRSFHVGACSRGSRHELDKVKFSMWWKIEP